MLEKLARLEEEYRELEALLSDPEVLKDQKRYQALSRRYAEMGELVEAGRAYRKALSDLESARELLSDPELKEVAKAEVEALEEQVRSLEEKLQVLLLPKDPVDERDAIVEIRAGTGGEEAALFAGDLLKMYLKFAEKMGFSTEVLDSHPSDLGGFSKVVFEVQGPGAYGVFKYESGVHRVQRVPATETQGRIHTSTATVAVLPKAEEEDLKLNMDEIRIDVMRASGPGGQGVNTTDSAVRVVHLPTGIIVTCQDSRSQIKNKEKALTILRSRLLEMKRAEEEEKLRQHRLAQIGTGERSEKIRTYNFPQSRVTDHRIGFTTHDLEGVLEGDLLPLYEALKKADQERQLAALVNDAA
ncbi:peptide chain release factor 1 [Thermus filiformis]|uniref:Peptide chain release factor 1 n=1 Tax=Thermus filiformis TaxID=276 RepID=A0A0D6X929_THEFI|nr:peptide chain release factor 1 [Thermus filiformis]KIX84419.1 peptide chain release factor 1 [Thermus filiformis]